MFLIGGENLIDFIEEPGAPGLPIYRANPGGGPYNVAKAAARQEIETGYLTPISSDSLGQLLATDLGREAAVRLLAPRSAQPTSLAMVSLSNGQAHYQFYREGTADRDVTEASILATVPAAATAIFVGALALADGADAEAWAAATQTLIARDLFSAIDPNVRPAFIHDRPTYLKRLSGLLDQTDLIKLSDEDMAWIAPETAPEEAAKALAEAHRPGLLVLTLGAEGAIAFPRQGPAIRCPAAPVPNLVDTVGAGDTFGATLVADILRPGGIRRGAADALTSATIERMLTRAAHAAAINCGRAGCDPPTLAELDAAAGPL